MDAISQKKQARDFVERWRGRGDEKQDAQSFWRDLLVNVLGAPSATLANLVSFERKVPGGWIDVFIEDTGVLVEQKSIGIDLEKKQQQSDGTMLTPYEQGARYASRLPLSIRPRWIISCNFERMLIYDQENDPTGQEPQELLLDNLPNELYRLAFILDKTNSRIERERELSVKAGEIVGKLYRSFAEQYHNLDTDENEQRSLNMLIVRLVFLLYAEDAGLFNSHGALYDYLKPFPVEQMRRALMELFEILDTPEDKRDPYARPDLLEFRYVNGGLFADRSIIIPQFTEQIKLDLLVEASSKFDWSGVSPTIFGAVFESTLNPETRRSGGMHYTSVENIHKVIDPLFLDDLRDELERIEGLKSERDRRVRLKAFQAKLASINIFDPACGSGNFLTESYLSLRKLENRAIEGLQRHGTAEFGFEGELSPIKVSLSQFHGIEINDFAVSVAKTAMWIAESQMIEATQEIVYQVIDFLPLKSSTNICEGNALRMDWNEVLPAEQCAFICGNPPFYGARLQSAEQKADIQDVFHGSKNCGNVDYVSGWYMKAAEYIADRPIRCAYVSTNSICQGEQAAAIWGPIYDLGVRIDFAYDTFRWRNEANDQAHVYVVIVGFSKMGGPKALYHHETPDAEPSKENPANINAYLSAAPDVFVTSRSTPLSDVSPIVFGSMPNDGGSLLLKPEERDALVRRDAGSARFIKRFMGASEYINAKERYCIWLHRVPEAEYSACAPINERVEAVRGYRLESSRAATRKLAETPQLFGEIRQPDTEYIIVPRHSSERRRYIPMGFLGPDVICGDSNMLVPVGSLYAFGILLSQFHNAWMRTVCGRIKSDYRYSGGMVYNNFVWPDPTGEQRQRVAECAQSVLDARAVYPDASLADLYDPDKMPGNLREAHAQLDRAVEAAYGVEFGGDEERIVAHLFKLYAAATEGA